MSDEKFMSEIIAEICNYAVKNGMEPNDTLNTIAHNILAMLEICTFNNWKATECIEWPKSLGFDRRPKWPFGGDET